MKVQLTQKQLCELLSRNLGVTVDSVEIVECKEDVKSGVVGEAFPVPHNPREMTPEEYEADKGYRLLDEDEIKFRTTSYEVIQIYDEDSERAGFCWWQKYAEGCVFKATYRTKLSREELAKLS